MPILVSWSLSCLNHIIVLIMIFLVYCATAEEKAGWMQDLLGYILAALKYKKGNNIIFIIYISHILIIL
jgi:hypothetical protein